ncbi:MAG: hypothetical protein KDD82_03145 [Planctomycetes bacterium]|nr:hypothetical protein [Planctomycetota bacterium]
MGSVFTLVTCAEHPDGHPEDAPLRAALAARGAEVRVRRWDDPEVRWGETTAVLRTPWDYVPRLAEFRGWLDALEARGGRVVNPLGTLRWNLHKGYLLELAARGVAVVPSRLVPRGAAPDLSALRAETGWGELVIKPAVSAGARGTYRAPAEDPTIAARFAASVEAGDTLVQPFLPEVAGGELSLIYLGGAYSHAVLKVPARGDYRVQSDHGGAVLPLRTVAAPVREAAEAALAAAARPWTYARVDGVVVDGAFLLMELELLEPELFLTRAPRAAERFAEALLEA